MAVTVVVRTGRGAGRELSITLDAPRVVIGRSDGCEVRLPDPSVSHRHASLRQRGGDYVLVDEGSANGTFHGPVRLPPQTPHVMRSGDRVRVGRVWLEVRFEPVLVHGSQAAAAKELALALVTRGLEAQGEDPSPRIDVIEGPDAGASVALVDPGRRYLIGRDAAADLVLASDPDAGWRHVEITRKGDTLAVRDLGARGGTVLDGAPLGAGDAIWRAGQTLVIGRNRFVFAYPAAEALSELERSSDERMDPREAPEPPEDAAVNEAGGDTPTPPAFDPGGAPTPTPDSVSVATAMTGRPPPGSRPKAEGGGWGAVDAFVALLALGVLALSIAGAFWLFAR